MGTYKIELEVYVHDSKDKGEESIRDKIKSLLEPITENRVWNTTIKDVERSDGSGALSREEQAIKLLKSNRRDFLQINQVLYAQHQHGYELAVKDINEFLGDRDRNQVTPLPEDNVVILTKHAP